MAQDKEAGTWDPATDFTDSADDILWGTQGGLGRKFSKEILKNSIAKGYNIITDIVADIAAAGSAKTTLVLVDTQTLNAPLNIPSNISIKPVESGLIITNSNTVDFDGTVIGSPLFQWISGSGVVFGASVKSVIPEWWGCDGVDETDAVQYALDANSTVEFLERQYEVTHLDLNTNNQLLGRSWASIMHQVSGTVRRAGGADGIFNINRPGSSTPIKNVGIRNMTLSMDTVIGAYTPGDDEHEHLIMTVHCQDITVDNVFFSGWRGDAIIIGSQGLVNPTDLVTKNMTVTNCFFDGLTYKTRQAISILSSDGLKISNNRITRTTDASMPGAIDIEPDLPTAFIRNINIEKNDITDIGDIGVGRKYAFIIDLGNLTSATPERRGRLSFSNNYVKDTNGFNVIGSGHDETPEPENLVVDNNFFDTNSRLDFALVHGLVFKNNYLKDGFGILLGFNLSKAQKIKIKDNIFYRDGGTGAVINIGNTSDVEISGNTFEDCGVQTGIAAAAILLISGGGADPSELLNIHDNVFSTPNALTDFSLSVQAGHVQDSINSKWHNNILLDSIAQPVGWTGKLQREDSFALIDPTNRGIFYTGGIGSGGSVTLADNENITLSTGVNDSWMVAVSNGSTGVGALFFMSYGSATITKLSDVGGDWSVADIDGNPGMAIFKSAGSSTVTIKNYANGVRVLTINVIGSYVSGSTAPA